MSVVDSLMLPSRAVFPSEAVYKLTVEQYHEMIRAGTLTDDDPVELLEGVLVLKMSKNKPHKAATRLLNEMLVKLLPAGWFYDSQNPLTLLDSEPDPDGLIVRGKTKDFNDRDITAADVCIVVEVADASLARDRTVKHRIYARAGVTTYWLVNASNRTVEIYSDPVAGDNPHYSTHHVFDAASRVPLILDGKQVAEIAVGEILA
jgi:Uma2 family endonuclease